MNSVVRWGAVAVLLSVVAMGCDDEEPVTSVQSVAPGFGASTEPPEGTPLALPAGVSIADGAPGIFIGEDCADPTHPPLWVGSGSNVRLCLTFRNDNTEPVDLVLPPGFIVVSEDTRTQNGILVAEVTIPLPAMSQRTVGVAFYCLNSHRATADDTDRFSVGPVTTYVPMLDLLTMLEDKYIENFGNLDVQLAVWAITEGAELTPEMIAAIEALPNP